VKKCFIICCWPPLRIEVIQKLNTSQAQHYLIAMQHLIKKLLKIIEIEPRCGSGWEVFEK